MKKYVLAAVSAAVLLTACGGGGNSGETKATITSVKVVGASLADSGAFGYKFTVQPTGGAVHQVYSERIAATYGLGALCPVYTTANFGGSWTGHAGCTNYAVAGARVNYTTDNGTTAIDVVPVSAIKQLVDVGAAGFSSTDLLIVGEASANDVAALAEAYGNTKLGGTTHFPNMLSSLSITHTAGMEAAEGVAYMQAVADKLVTAIKANALDKGAPRIAVLNVLDVTLTPKFQAQMAQLSALTTSLGGNGPAAAAGLQTMVRAWVQAFNSRVASGLAPYGSKVAVVDFYTNFSAEMADPAQYGLTNTGATVCDQIYAGGANPGGTSLAPTSLGTTPVKNACTDSAASAITPTVGATGATTWWQTYLFADNFHPTPYGHQLLAQLVAKRLTEAGWL